MIRTVILGVGNSASALVQGIEYYKKIENNKGKTDEYGLWHPLVGNYKISDIDLVGAYDIEKNKIGLELNKSIFSSSNKLEKFINDRLKIKFEVYYKVRKDENKLRTI